jgi:hypothetical protein
MDLVVSTSYITCSLRTLAVVLHFAVSQHTAPSSSSQRALPTPLPSTAASSLLPPRRISLSTRRHHNNSRRADTADGGDGGAAACTAEGSMPVVAFGSNCRCGRPPPPPLLSPRVPPSVHGDEHHSYIPSLSRRAKSGSGGVRGPLAAGAPQAGRRTGCRGRRR